MKNNKILKAASIKIILFVFVSQLFTAGPAFAQPTSVILGFTATRSGDTLTIQVRDFPENTKYYVKVKSAFAPASAWEKVGNLRVNDSGESNATFRLLTPVLRKASQLDVCLKNIANSRITCIVTAARSTPMLNQNRPFTATKSGNTLSIEVWNFPPNTSYNVRVKNTLASVSGWKKIGVLRVNNRGAGSVRLRLPNALRNDSELDVCLKNVGNNSLTCTTTAATSTSLLYQRRVFTATKNEDVLSIQVRNFLNDAKYYVKVRPIGAPASAWEKIGILRVNNNGEGNATFRLRANALKNASQLEICLKSFGNDGAFCIVTAATSFTP